MMVDKIKDMLMRKLNEVSTSNTLTKMMLIYCGLHFINKLE